MNFSKKAISLAGILLIVVQSLPAQVRQTREEYIDRYKSIAVAHMERYGIPASITMAQGILESDCGNSWLSLQSNNHFGIKCKRNWTGDKVYYDDDAKGECFRSYPSVEASYRDHAEFLDSQPRYDSLFAYSSDDYKSWARGLKAAGYATAPDYAQRLTRIIKENQILLPESYLKGMGALTSSASQNRHTKGSWYYVWKGEYEIMENFPEYLPNTYLNYYLQAKEFVEHSDPNHTRANEVEETREKNLFDGIDHYLKTGEVDANTFYAGSHGDWIADLSAALKNDTKARFLIITENRGAIPNMPYDAMVELPAYIGKNGPEVIARDNIPLFQQGLMMQQLNSEKLLVEGCVEGSYEKVLQAFTLNKTVPSMNVAKAILDDMIEANKGYWPELH